MYANGFFEEKRRSPAGFAAVAGVHVALLGVLALYGTTQFVLQKGPTTIVRPIPIDPDPPPPPPPPPPSASQPTPRQNDTVTVTDRVLPTPDSTITGEVTPPRPYQEPTTPAGPVVLAENMRVEIPPPVRRGAEVDSRYRDALQPPYPRDQEAAQREGQVRVRITIGTDGRVTAIEQLFATNESFWRATERQARSRWRFRPATVDGRPVVSTMNFTVTFRLPEA
ncbi:MAG TPA: TonB family protein [Allosphingosinicella sp.]|nr:TonB family protein [Allosphingosinicella sp.]